VKLALAMTLGVALVAGVGTAVVEAQTSDGPGGAPGLTLEPSSGRQGTPVTAVVSGFDNCGASDDVRPAEALIRWDDEEQVAAVELETGGGDTSFLIPDAASFGPHRVVARCATQAALQAVETFEVEQVEVLTVVPDVIGETREAATAALLDADLVVGQVTGDGEVVRSQDPLGNTEAEPGTPVDLDLGVAPVRVPVPDLVGQPIDAVAGLLEAAGLTPGGASGEGDIVVRQSPLAATLVPVGTSVDIVRGTVPPGTGVEVPDLTGVALDDVPAVLAGPGLVLGVVEGDGGFVRDQEPAPGTLVPSGSSVNVSVESAVDPETLVPVPDLVGLTADEARQRVEADGLILGGELEVDEQIADQDPAAGTFVPLGTVVTVRAEIPTTPIVTPDPPDPWPSWLLAAVAALLAAAWLVRRLLRSRRDRRWVRRHVRVERGPTTAGGPVVFEDGDRPTRVIRLEPHLDSDTPTLEEVAP
jgi:beta-lactam-binding protein with PASTA domain